MISISTIKVKVFVGLKENNRFLIKHEKNIRQLIRKLSFFDVYDKSEKTKVFKMEPPQPKSVMITKKPEEIFDTVMKIDTDKEKASEKIEEIIEILKKAFGPKISEINSLDETELLLGINWDPAHDNTEDLIRGPHPKAEDAAEFRKFWNNKSTIHRFKDGSLAEAVSIHGENPVIEIAQLSLRNHFSPDVRVTLAHRTLSGIFAVGGNDLPAGNPQQAFDDLASKLTSLKDLTVAVTNVIPISPFLRGTAVFPYTPIDGKTKYLCKCAEKINIIIKLQGFTAWPTKLKPLIQYKIATFIAIHKALAEIGIQSQPTMEGIDILYRGYVFSAVGIHNNEMSDFEGTEHGNEIDRVDRIEKLLHSTIRANTMKYRSFADATRAAIRWVRCKGVSNELFPTEVIELLVAYIYETTTAPKSAYTGFIRFVALIANLALNKQNVFELLGCVSEVPKGDSRLLVVAAPFCRKSEFTENGPSKVVIKRLKAAAIKAINDALSRDFLDPTGTLRMVFSSIKEKQAEIELDFKQRPFAGRALFSKSYFPGVYDVKGLVSPQLSDLIIGFDPVHQFVLEIQERFGDIFDVWYNEYGGTKIGISWDSDLLENKLPIKDPNFNMSKRVGNELCCDIDAILSQIAILGGELVKSIKKIE